MTCFKSFALAFALLLPPLFSGCGYRIGARSLVHPQIKSIAVGEIKNDTLEPLAASIMRQQLCERYMFDGALKLKNKADADCILSGTIRSVKNTTIREDDTDNDIYRPAEFRLEVEPDRPRRRKLSDSRRPDDQPAERAQAGVLQHRKTCGRIYNRSMVIERF